MISDKKLIEMLKQYAKSYNNGEPYGFNPGLALIIANRMEQLITLAENGQSAIETSQILAEKLQAAVADIKQAISGDDHCLLCAHYVPCLGKECDSYTEGDKLIDEKGKYISWKWTCQDFDWGDCPKMDVLPCKNCDFVSDFVWRGNQK